jgi:hypothetical protein
MTKEERKAEVIRLWYEQPEDQRTEDWIALFHGRRCAGLCTYSEIKTILLGHTVPKKTDPKPAE